MVDLPERSVLVMGLDSWEMFGTGTFKPSRSPASSDSFTCVSKMTRRIVGDRPPEFRTPPIDAGDPKRQSPAIKATVFPRWFACDADRQGSAKPAPPRSLPGSRTAKASRSTKAMTAKRRKASPIRFVCGCENGHLQDIDWRWVVHQNARAKKAEAPAPARERCGWRTRVRAPIHAIPGSSCDCGASLSLEELFQPGRLGPCPGERPWIGDNDPNPATHQKGCVC